VLDQRELPLISPNFTFEQSAQLSELIYYNIVDFYDLQLRPLVSEPCSFSIASLIEEMKDLLIYDDRLQNKSPLSLSGFSTSVNVVSIDGRSSITRLAK
jgi:hypothetical protein